MQKIPLHRDIEEFKDALYRAKPSVRIFAEQHEDLGENGIVCQVQLNGIVHAHWNTSLTGTVCGKLDLKAVLHGSASM